MSFDLPRNAKGLRFTGNVKSLAETDAPPSVLGKPRPRAAKPPPPPPSSAPPRSHHAPRIVTPAPVIARKVDAREVSYDDEVATMAMDRDGLDVMPGGGFRGVHAQVAPQTQRPPAPIPNFRPAPHMMAPPQRMPPPRVEKKKKKPSGATLALWVLASVVAAVLSYKLAPEALDRAGIVIERRN